jgi:subtilisin family serine protease
LSSQIWTNSDEIPGNGIDDDNNGLIDDYKGYNFGEHNSDVASGSTHGTHISGIIAGQAGNFNFTGVAPNAKIMPLKFIDASGSGSVGDALVAMEYAVAHGAKVINASWGGELCSNVLEGAIQAVTQAGVVFVTAAGNSGHDISRFPEWPAVYQIAGKLTIAAHNFGQTLSSFSNYGQLVDLSAPGDSILSTVPPQTSGQAEGQMCGLRGTSMAAPFASGIAALLLSAKPLLSPSAITNAINSGVTQGNFGVRTRGKLNALQSAQIILNN